MAHMLDDDVRCRDCGHIGPAGTYERWAQPGEPADDRVYGAPVVYEDCCERCESLDITTASLCRNCGVNDATDEDWCHTCAIAFDTDELVAESRAGIERIDDLHQTIRDITLAQAVRP